jgi:hypothetical protein
VGFWLIQLRREEAVRMDDAETADVEALSSQFDVRCPTADLVIARDPESR